MHKNNAVKLQEYVDTTTTKLVHKHTIQLIDKQGAVLASASSASAGIASAKDSIQDAKNVLFNLLPDKADHAKVVKVAEVGAVELSVWMQSKFNLMIKWAALDALQSFVTFVMRTAVVDPETPTIVGVDTEGHTGSPVKACVMQLSFECRAVVFALSTDAWTCISPLLKHERVHLAMWDATGDINALRPYSGADFSWDRVLDVKEISKKKKPGFAENLGEAAGQILGAPGRTYKKQVYMDRAEKAAFYGGFVVKDLEDGLGLGTEHLTYAGVDAIAAAMALATLM